NAGGPTMAQHEVGTMRLSRRNALRAGAAVGVTAFAGSIIGPAQTATVQAASADMIEPNAGTWKTWLLTSGSQMRLPAPPSDDATIAAWDSKYAYNRPRPSVFDPTLKAALPLSASPSYPSEHAVTAGAASTVLAAIFPKDAQSFLDQAEEAGRSRLLAGVQY